MLKITLNINGRASLGTRFAWDAFDGAHLGQALSFGIETIWKKQNLSQLRNRFSF